MTTRLTLTSLLATILVTTAGCKPKASRPGSPATADVSSSEAVARDPSTPASASSPRRAGEPATTTTTTTEAFLTIARAITELDTARASALLREVPEAERVGKLLRARLALSMGDCEGALAASSSFGRASGPLSEFERVAEGCARAMAGASVIQDDSQGIWVRLQNPRDKVLVPILAGVATKVRASLKAHLGVTMPLPLRFEVVSDLMSLSYLTGLSLQAAETTGTIAIARFGRVILVSPRATVEGFPWQDTVAHELTHLAVTRLSRDEAPLWLQEGIAKREETRWRPAAPADDPRAAHLATRRALAEGRFIAIDDLGPSIAMLPTPRDAATAYAEVQDFLDYVTAQTGDAVVALLLQELRTFGQRRVDDALRSASGYDFKGWLARWKHALSSEPPVAPDGHVKEAEGAPTNQASLHTQAGLFRTATLLGYRRHWSASASLLGQLTAMAQSGRPSDPEVRLRLSLAHERLNHGQLARDALGTEASLSRPDGAWLALLGRLESKLGNLEAAEAAFERSLAFAPTVERVACRGRTQAEDDSPGKSSILPRNEPWQSLCLDALGTDHP